MEEESGKKRGEQRHTKVGQMQVASIGGCMKLFKCLASSGIHTVSG